MSEKDFEQLQKSWEELGVSSPHWSVLTEDCYTPQNIENSIEQFFDTGKGDIDFLETVLKAHGSTLKDKVVLDFGCGVGRLTKPCAELAHKVYGVDISKPHLEIAKKEVPNAEFLLFTTHTQQLKISAPPDIIISLIVMQHIRPSILVRFITNLLRVLKKDGIALIHIPYHITGYVSGPHQQGAVEMHYLPKDNLRTLTQDLGCVLLEEIETNKCGDPDIQECLYGIKKVQA